MAQPPISPYPISDFVEWYRNDQLVLAPKFQRRDVWDIKAKSYLIDTIIHAMPIPPIYLRQRIDPIAQRMIREVVDGQQRLRAVLGYIDGDFPILEAHNSEYGRCRFNDLPNDLKTSLMTYKFSVSTLEDVSDAEILDIFARLNTYTLPLKAQELLNAEFFGDFKQCMYEIAHKHLSFWSNHCILTDMQIARMQDAKLVSEISICLIDGIKQTKFHDIRSVYKGFDDKFPKRKVVTRQFSETLHLLGSVYGDKLRNTPFRRIPLFFSLFLAFYNSQFGLPGSKYQKIKLTSRTGRVLQNRLDVIGAALAEKEPRRGYEKFVDASRRGTADGGKRRLRHDFLMRKAFMEAVSTE